MTRSQRSRDSYGRRLLATIAACATLLTACGNDTETTGSTPIENVAAATVLIEVEGSFSEFGAPEAELTNSGTGFFIDASGLAVTNNHVVTGAAIIRVRVPGESSLRNARVRGVSECSDLAVIEVDGDGFEHLDWFQGTVAPGLSVYAAGYPDGSYTVTRGILSQVDVDVDTAWASVDGALEHDARTAPGSSGGPVVTESGEIVGISYARTDLPDQSLAIGSRAASPLIERLISGENVDGIGVNGQAFEDAEFDARGIWVISVETGSPAYEVGVRGGDVITHLGGLTVGQDGSMSDYCDVIRSNRPDSQLRIEVYRPATDQFLEGTLNGSPLEESFSFAGGSADGTTYDDYQVITDDSGRIAVEVPTDWADIDGASYLDDRGNEIFDVVVTPDLQGFLEGWDVSGVRISASYDLARSTNELDILSDYYDGAAAFCTYVETQPYEDPFYFGEYDVYIDCDGSDSEYYVLAVVPNSRAFVIWIEAVVTADRDLEALDRILNSFVFS